VRQLLKTAVEFALCGWGVTRFARHIHRHRTIILAYHNIVPHGEPVFGDISLHLSQINFADQLDLIASTHEVVPVTDIDAPRSSSRPRAVITFDDAYQGALTVGVEELVKRGLPATIFVSPALLGGQSFWWDALATSPTGLSGELREHGLTKLAGQDAIIREWSESRGISPHAVPHHQTTAREDLLRAAVSTGLITFGSHTWTHPNLTRLGPEQLEDELRRPLIWLRERFSSIVPMISYPYGLCSPAVEKATRACGYESAFLISGGWVKDAKSFSQPRFNIPAGVSARGFELRSSGFLSK
jgi:peptidoglycan/xylan/chitin deacetylase (PgdA/CDA1 family)